MITLTITQEDMEKGIINSPSSDPIALAAQRAGLIHPLVGRTGMSFTHGTRRAHVPFGPELRQFITKLAYGDRHEMLPLKRGKNDSFEHLPVTFVLKPQQVELEALPQVA